jgi:ERCC4-type nuclease
MGVTVLVDDREPPAVVRSLRDHPDVDAVSVERLVAGDVVVGDAGFERKTSADYVRSALGRGGTDLREQVERLAEAYANAYVLLEGEVPADDDLALGPAASIRGSMASITARQGVPVLPCSDLSRLVDMAVRIGRKHAEDPSPRPLSPGAVTDAREPAPKRMYGCIDGVGPRTAARLYEAYPTVESLVRASRAELETVDGVGPKRAAAICGALGSE